MLIDLGADVSAVDKDGRTPWDRASSTSRTDAEQEQLGAEARLAMALTQVFDYMVAYRVAYGYVAAGESLLLLHVDRADPQTLFCYP
ncbi:hypothetical protein JX266_014536, partial [Neoarthrinium moseri]